MDKLLNKLMWMGWKPFSGNWVELQYYQDLKMFDLIFQNGNSHGTYETGIECSLNDICSIDSGLRQFVCRMRLYNKEYDILHHTDKGNSGYTIHSYEYRTMLSSIQSDKEKFILDNVKT